MADRGQHRRSRVGPATLALLAAVVPAAAGPWCDLPFKEVAASAPAIALARWEADGVPGRLPVVELIRGELRSDMVTLDPDRLRGYRLRDGALFLFALDADGEPVRALGQTGFCEPVSILPIRGGVLRSRFRPDYDGRRAALPLDRLRAELLEPRPLRRSLR